MFEEDPVRQTIRSLEDMSLEELNERVAMLESEIEACKSMIDKKEAQKKAADAIFGGGD